MPSLGLPLSISWIPHKRQHSTRSAPAGVKGHSKVRGVLARRARRPLSAWWRLLSWRPAGPASQGGHVSRLVRKWKQCPSCSCELVALHHMPGCQQQCLKCVHVSMAIVAVTGCALQSAGAGHAAAWLCFSCSTQNEPSPGSGCAGGTPAVSQQPASRTPCPAGSGAMHAPLRAQCALLRSTASLPPAAGHTRSRSLCECSASTDDALAAVQPRLRTRCLLSQTVLQPQKQQAAARCIGRAGQTSLLGAVS